MLVLSMYPFINSFLCTLLVLQTFNVDTFDCSLEMARKWAKIGDVSSKNARNVQKYVLMSMYAVYVVHGQVWVNHMGRLSTTRSHIDYEKLSV